MRLYLVQHGQAMNKAVNPDRPLSREGEAEVNRIASILSRIGTAPGRIVHSGKTRARQTAELFDEALGAKTGPTEISGIAPLDSVIDFAVRVSEMAEDTMVCGHQPFVGRLVSRLLAGDEDIPLVEFSPGSVACLERGADGIWVLCWLIRPELCPPTTDRTKGQRP
jgi:phosphohistidine phosphatase